MTGRLRWGKKWKKREEREMKEAKVCWNHSLGLLNIYDVDNCAILGLYWWKIFRWLPISHEIESTFFFVVFIILMNPVLWCYITHCSPLCIFLALHLRSSWSPNALPITDQFPSLLRTNALLFLYRLDYVLPLPSSRSSTRLSHFSQSAPTHRNHCSSTSLQYCPYAFFM